MTTRKESILAEVKQNLENQEHNGYKPSEDLRDEAGSMFDGNYLRDSGCDRRGNLRGSRGTSEMRVKETGSDKWVAKLKVSGYSSNSDDATHFQLYRRMGKA